MNLAGKRVAIYARFSSENQREASIADQVRRCSQHVERLGGDVAQSLIFDDRAISGATAVRPGFEKMMRLATATPPQIDAIVTEDMSRISRDFADSAVIFKRLQFSRVPLLGVSDGIDTSARGAKMAYTFSSMKNDLFLDDLREKTVRGLEGRALAGMSTGMLPFGFCSSPATDAYGNITGYRIEVHPERAAIVRRMFADYIAGASLATVAIELVRRGVQSPRAHTRHARKGWSAETIRVILRNEKYIGRWTYGASTWVRDPSTGAHVKQAPLDRVPIVTERRDLAIVEPATFEAARTRSSQARTFYRSRGSGAGVPQKKTEYPFSSLLYCSCGAPMIVYNSRPARYRCAAFEKRKLCSNDVSFRDDAARPAILGAIRERLGRPEAVAYAQKRIAAKLGAAGREVDGDLVERRGRLARHEERIRGLVNFIADGDRSDAVVSALLDLEASAKSERAAITEIEQRARQPVNLPSVERVREMIGQIETAVTAEPTRAREALRTLLGGGRFVMTAQPDRTYHVKSTLYPLALSMYNTAGSARSRLL